MTIYDLWLSLSNISNKSINTLLQKFNSAEQLFHYCRESKTLNDTLFKLFNSWNKEELLKIEELINKKNICVITAYNSNYPESIKRLEDHPHVLYYFGNIEILSKNRCISIVGSRKCSQYGIMATEFIAKILTDYNINVVSGMASGIDSAAHNKVLSLNGLTTAILGCGIDVIYPSHNRKLYNNLKEKGLIISEFPPGTPPLRYNFPMRNRIISSLSDSVIIVEAGEKSGSLITANLALNDNKTLVAIPGSIFSEKSIGTNKLIRDGCYPFTTLEDFLSLLNLNYINKRIKNTGNPYEKGSISYKLYNNLSDIPMHIDDIIKVTDVDIKLIYALLLEMQLNETIKCISGSYYVKLNSLQ